MTDDEARNMASVAEPPRRNDLGRAAERTSEVLIAPAAERLLTNARWLVRLRWVAVVGQLSTIATAVVVLRVPLPLLALFAIVTFTALSNVVLATWLNRRQEQSPTPVQTDADNLVLVAVLALDMLSLTGLLYFSGGPSNPFAVFYFVNISLAAVIVPTRWSWSLTTLAILCFGFLLNRHVPLPALADARDDPSAAAGWTYPQAGLGVAIAACASVVTYFITRVTRGLHQREDQLREAEKRRARSERLEALATLAAGAGHELASPLSTIAVIAKDLTKHLEGTNAPPSVLEDVALIRSELDQCRRVLNSMASGAGQAMGEEMQPVEVKTLVDEVVSIIRRRDQLRVTIAPQTAPCQVYVPLAAAAQSLRGIVRNALDVSSIGEPVELTARREGEMVVLVVRDRGPGMSPEILARAGDPFFTTKEPGKGMGLGLFLARNVVERIGGTLSIDSTAGTGTTVTVRLPLGKLAA